MKKQITFFIASNTGSSIRKITISSGFFMIGCCILLGVLIVLGFIGHDYYLLKHSSFELKMLKTLATSQRDEIVTQRRQIQAFGEEINALKTQLIDLNEFEKKIRIIANIEKPVGQDGLFGVGGAIPEDLDTNVDLTEKHNSLLRAMHEQVENLDQISTRQNEGFGSLLKYLEDQRNLLAATPAICPTKGWVTSRFGYRKSPFTGLREFHKGLDIATRIGTPIIATADGIVSYSGKKGLLGNVVVIDHGHGMVTRYAHLNRASAKKGEKVKRGEVIAEVGNTGRSTGPHLHYEVRLNGIAVNPERYILN